MASTTVNMSNSAAAVERTYKPLTPFQLALRRFRKNRLAIIGFVVVVLFLLTAILAPILSPYPYDKTSYYTFVAPGVMPQYPLGTDEAGRDFLSRIIWGANTSLTVGIAVQLFSLIIGLLLGFSSAWFMGWIDFVVNRALEITGAMPGLLFQILIMALLGNGLWNVTIAIALLAWPGYVRLIRSEVLRYKQSDYVEAARSLGANTAHIAWRHIFPNILNNLLISISFGLPAAMVAEAGLSFLGRGINDPIPSWGKMLGTAGAYVQSYIHLALIPTILIMVMFIGFSFFGDGVRDALDPRADRAL
jgi:oligopeptide transport system permease protein